jgi:hypothetical protein
MTNGPARKSAPTAHFTRCAVGIEPVGRSQRPPQMRPALATILRLIGFALGLAAAGLLIALQWPDMMADLYSANAFRHFVRMFIVGILSGSLIAWPFIPGR